MMWIDSIPISDRRRRRSDSNCTFVRDFHGTRSSWSPPWWIHQKWLRNTIYQSNIMIWRPYLVWIGSMIKYFSFSLVLQIGSQFLHSGNDGQIQDHD